MIFGVECVDSSLQRVYHGTPTWRQSRLLWVAMHFGHVGENTLLIGMQQHVPRYCVYISFVYVMYFFVVTVYHICIFL